MLSIRRWASGVAAVAMVLGGSSLARAQIPTIPPVSKPNVPKPNLPKPNLPKPNVPKPTLPDKPNPIDEARRKAEELDRERRKLRDQVDRARREFRDLEAKAKKAKEISTTVAELNSPDRRTRERAYARLRREHLLHSNKARVDAGHRRGGASVIYGVEIDHYDEKLFAEAVVASVASGTPAPVLAYLEQLLTEMGERLQKELAREKAQVRQKVMREYRMLVVKAMKQAIQGGGRATVDLPKVHVEGGLATYNNWVNLVYDEPRLVETRKVLGVQLYEVRTKRVEKKLTAPNTFRPYVLVRPGSASLGR